MSKGLLKIYYFFIACLILPVVFTSCRDKYEGCTDEDYANCRTSKPSQAIVEVLVTLNSENPTVQVSLYEGNFEDGNLVWEKTYRNRDEAEIIKTDTDYSFTAKYISGNDTILAVDGGRVRIISYQMCELRCYEVRDRDLTFDLRID